jgi:hypothetical protein
MRVEVVEWRNSFGGFCQWLDAVVAFLLLLLLICSHFGSLLVEMQCNIGNGHSSLLPSIVAEFFAFLFELQPIFGQHKGRRRPNNGQNGPVKIDIIRLVWYFSPLAYPSQCANNK